MPAKAVRAVVPHDDLLQAAPLERAVRLRDQPVQVRLAVRDALARALDPAVVAALVWLAPLGGEGKEAARPKAEATVIDRFAKPTCLPRSR